MPLPSPAANSSRLPSWVKFFPSPFHHIHKMLISRRSLPPYFATLLRLSRAQMTVITGVTHLTASLISPTFNSTKFFITWIFILLTQFATHFLGELYDLPSDKLNIYATPLTGGSRVLPNRLMSPSHTARLAAITTFLAALSICALEKQVRLLAVVIVILATQYSAPPLLLNHRALGEIDASLITSVLVPILSSSVQGHPNFNRLLLLTVPPVFTKFSLFLVLNQADRRPDYVSSKVTLPVILGDRGTARLHSICMALTYVSLFVIFGYTVQRKDIINASAAAAMALSAPYGFRIVKALRNMPYRLDSVLPGALLHSTMLVWALLLQTLIIRMFVDGMVSVPIAVAAGLAKLTLQAFRRRPGKHDVEAGVVDDPLRIENAERGYEKKTDTEVGDLSGGSSTGRVATTVRDADGKIVSCDVTIVGGGVAGLVAATALHKMGHSVVVLERRSCDDVDQGADLALWPGAISILKALGVPEEFFNDECFPLDTVHMCNMDFSSGVAEILKTIDMVAVTEGTGQRFVLVPRQQLMSALAKIVPQGVVVFDAQVVDVVEKEELQTVTISYDTPLSEKTSTVTSRIAIGADGARSRLRKHISPDRGGEDAIRYCGEVCYRGILPLSTMSSVDRGEVERLFPDRASDHTMRINYGAGLRSSFGYMTADGNVAYWWVKQISSTIPERTKLLNCPWPEPLRSLHDLTPPDMFYMHPIEDSATLPRWCSSRVVLIGDAAHVVTPNMGQGACLATEDAFMLAVELKKHWKWPDGHLEAFYQYEFCRKPFAEGVAAEARKQLALGQLQAWPLVWVREWLLRIVPESVLRKTLRKNNFDVTGYIDEFREAVLRS